MQNFKSDSIENKFIKAVSLIPENQKLLLAVSGGADSIAMLSLFSEFAKTQKLEIIVASVNHNLRSEKESLFDIELVQSYCETLCIPYFIKTAEPGFIKGLAKKRKKGLEEAARFFRYAFFDSLAKDEKVNYIVTAHNKNDNVETLLGRFLQGSLVGSGIQMLRAQYFKPLLDCTRQEIEAYLKIKRLSYSIDKTNRESIFFRNKIRNVLLPFLDTHFFGWQKAVLQGAKKKAIDENFFDRYLDALSFDFPDKDKAVFSEKHFFALDQAIQIRLLYKTFSQFSVEQRISFSVVETVMLKQAVETDEIRISFTDGNLWIVKKNKAYKKKHFFAIVEKECHFYTNYGIISVNSANKKKECRENNKGNLKDLSLPLSLSFDGEKIKNTVLHADKQNDERFVLCLKK